jgi:hypothetical protein
MKWKEFLNPRSMLTPGVAGSMVMVIANTLWVEFMVPQKWTALILSFLLILPILIQFSAHFFEKIIYFTFNGLIVFALSVNTNFAGKQLQGIVVNDINNNKNIVSNQQTPIIFRKLISSAFLDKDNTSHRDTINHIQLVANDKTITTNTNSSTTTTTEVVKENKKPDSSNTENKIKNNNQNKNQKKRQFFDTWF